MLIYNLGLHVYWEKDDLRKICTLQQCLCMNGCLVGLLAQGGTGGGVDKVHMLLPQVVGVGLQPDARDDGTKAARRPRTAGQLCAGAGKS